MAIIKITADKAPAAIGPYSHAILANGVLYTSGQIGVDPATGELVEGIEAQTKRAFENIKQVIASAGMGVNHVVKTTVFLADIADFAKVNEIYADFFKGVRNIPARSCVQVAALPKGALIEIEITATRG